MGRGEQGFNRASRPLNHDHTHASRLSWHFEEKGKLTGLNIGLSTAERTGVSIF
jgi:hypothetical protein